MRTSLIFGGALGLLLLSGCTSLATIPGGCGSPPNDGICLGEMTVPRKKSSEFVLGSRQAIDAIASKEFKADLEYFIREFGRSGQHSSAWTGMDADGVVTNLLNGIDGVRIVTMNDLAGIYRKAVYGTVAIEGNPINFNPFNIGRSSTIANSIGHEASHNPPLRREHPHYYTGSSDKEKEVGLCEPPYVIGSLVQKRIEGSAFAPEGHCSLLREMIEARSRHQN